MQALLVAVQSEVDLDGVQVKASKILFGGFRELLLEWIVPHVSSR
jgi:hypothetical protein